MNMTAIGGNSWVFGELQRRPGVKKVNVCATSSDPQNDITYPLVGATQTMSISRYQLHGCKYWQFFRARVNKGSIPHRRALTCTEMANGAMGIFCIEEKEVCIEALKVLLKCAEISPYDAFVR